MVRLVLCIAFLPGLLMGQTFVAKPMDILNDESPLQGSCQVYSDSSFRKKKVVFPVLIGSSAAAATLGLYFLWYKDYPMESFHFFDDVQLWGGMDKLGHAGSAYGLAEMVALGAKPFGYSAKEANAMGAISALGFLSCIEVLDGFSKGWGFSPWDALANTGGVGLFYFQQQAWAEQRIRIKFSWWPSNIARLNPLLLGDGFPSTLLKDYNAQRYWLSVSPMSFSKKTTKKRFGWLALAVGYGIDGYVGARANEGDYMYIPRTQHLYLAPDIHWSKIPSRHRFLRGLFHALDYLKFPAPTLEFGWGDQTRLRFHWLFF